MITSAINIMTTPRSPSPLAVLRIGLALLLLIHATLIWTISAALIGDDGVISPKLQTLLIEDSIPQLRQLSRLSEWLNMDQQTVVRWFLMLHIVSLVFMLLGYGRLFTVIAWLSFVVLKTALGATVYGVHDFLNIGMFYCVVFPSEGHIFISGPASHMAGLGCRVLQIHLTIVYMSSGFWKATAGAHWWNGNAVWWAVNDPLLKGWVNVSWVELTPWLAVAAGWSTLACELGYGVVMWKSRTRPYGLAATVLMHFGIGVVLGLWLFAATMILLNVVAWLPERGSSGLAALSTDSK